MLEGGLSSVLLSVTRQNLGDEMICGGRPRNGRHGTDGKLGEVREGPRSRGVGEVKNETVGCDSGNRLEQAKSI